MIRILKVKCRDQVGIISKISTILLKHQVNIIRLDEYVDPSQKSFFLRAEIDGSKSSVQLKSEIKESLQGDAQITLRELERKKIVILATKEPHCLGDLLLRGETSSLDIEIQCVISNHEDLSPLTKRFNIPFHFITHKELSRQEHALKIQEKLSEYDFDYIVLAKYMRILPPEFVESYENKIINIHHSFLPAFIGAKPYHQAHDRGVKMIGATSHFVTENLDEGPIIEQDVLKINHSYGPKELSVLGKDVEQFVLSKALKYVTEDRVFIHQNKTVVFK